MPPFTQAPTTTSNGSYQHPPLWGRNEVVIMVDPYSTGCCIAQEAAKRGYTLIAVWSRDISEEMKLHVPTSCADLTYYTQITERSTVEETAQIVQEALPPGFTIAACICGGDTGVSCCDALSEQLGVRSNGTSIPHRRDKKIQQELIKANGLRSVRQAGSKHFEQVDEFLQRETYPVVVKPVESAGSDGVKLCHTYEEAKQHFFLLRNSQRQAGSPDAAVLCQEFLKGREYVVDHVSRDGTHKTTMIWVYDKRPVNGAAFVYFGLLPVDSNSDEAKVLIPYVRGVLDALGIKNGPTHGEVMMTKDGPCLVEMNCRAHGGDGNWRPLVKALTGGYSQVDATVDCYLDQENWKLLPDKMPSPFKAAGQEVTLVSYSRGTVKKLPGYDVIKNLRSFVSLETRIDVGTEIDYTVDLFTDLGSVILVHKDENVVKRDVEFLRYMEEINAFFVYETKVENLKRPRGESVCLTPISETEFPLEEQKKGAAAAGAAAADQHRRVFSSDGPMLIRHFSNDRPELRGPLVKRATTVDASKEAVIVIDPLSTGTCIAKEIANRTYKVIALWTKDITEEMKEHVPYNCSGLKYFAQATEKDTIEKTLKAVKDAAKTFRIVACVCGGDTGVELADQLSEKLGVRTNGTEVPNRRSKKVQNETIRKAGLRAIRQVSGKNFADVIDFLKQTEKYPVVVKPVKSVGSDGVKLCHNFEEAKQHFNLLRTTQQVAGKVDEEVICEEYLRGKEYIVDHVSRDGLHKTTMVWLYDKRAVNGAATVYFGLLPVDPDSPDAKLIIPYVRRVLDALKFKNGPSHGEVIMTADGPCLVEMNCRAHGGDGNWQPLVRALTGYNPVDAAVDSFLDKERFFSLPDKPPSLFKASGQEVMLVSYSRGKVKSTPGFDKIRQLQSFVYLETGIREGSHVDYTVDLFTCAGSVILMHEDKNVLQKEVELIRQMEKNNELFEYDVGIETMISPSSVDSIPLSGLGISYGRHRRIISTDRPDVMW